MATVGQQLNSPEAGWKRYDDSDSAIKYDGAFGFVTSSSNPYGGTYHTANASDNEKISFRFTGTKFRVISTRNSVTSAGYVNRNNNHVKINGESAGGYSLYRSSLQYRTLVYESPTLPEGDHLVEITGEAGTRMEIDAVDTEDTGRLLHPDEVTDPEFLDVGKHIRCHYAAISNAIGVFSGLGQETSDFIPPASSATPDGDFYFVMVEDWNGEKRLIADRNIQHSISWDSLNSAGISVVGRSDLFGEEYTTIDSLVRLLTGGTSAADKDNEWDKYITDSSLDLQWHTESAFSWTSTTSGTADQRACRGRNSVEHFQVQTSNVASTTSGFRPMVILTKKPQTKWLFEDEGEIKKWVVSPGTIPVGYWEVVGPTPPTWEMFEEHGIDSLEFITHDALTQLSSPKILMLTPLKRNKEVLSVSAVPHPVLIQAVGDIDLKEVKQINYFTLVANVSGEGDVRIIVSTNEGMDWRSYKDGAWTVVEISDELVDVKSKGLLVSEFNALTALEWKELIGDVPTKIRFSYYLEINGFDDIANTDELIAEFDMQGVWRKAIHGTDYDYEYPSNSTMTIKLLQDGSYKINYTE